MAPTELLVTHLAFFEVTRQKARLWGFLSKIIELLNGIGQVQQKMSLLKSNIINFFSWKGIQQLFALTLTPGEVWVQRGMEVWGLKIFAYFLRAFLLFHEYLFVFQHYFLPCTNHYNLNYINFFVIVSMPLNKCESVSL